MNLPNGKIYTFYRALALNSSALFTDDILLSVFINETEILRRQNHVGQGVFYALLSLEMRLYISV